MKAILLRLHFRVVKNLESLLFAEPYGIAPHVRQKRVDDHSFEEIPTELPEVFLFRDKLTLAYLVLHMGQGPGQAIGNPPLAA